MAFILLWGGGGNYNVHYCNEIGSVSERAISNWAKTQRYNCWSSHWNRTWMRWGVLMMSFIPESLLLLTWCMNIVSAKPQLSALFSCILWMLHVQHFNNPPVNLLHLYFTLICKKNLEILATQLQPEWSSPPTSSREPLPQIFRHWLSSHPLQVSKELIKSPHK